MTVCLKRVHESRSLRPDVGCGYTDDPVTSRLVWLSTMRSLSEPVKRMGMMIENSYSRRKSIVWSWNLKH